MQVKKIYTPRLSEDWDIEEPAEVPDPNQPPAWRQYFEIDELLGRYEPTHQFINEFC